MLAHSRNELSAFASRVLFSAIFLSGCSTTRVSSLINVGSIESFGFNSVTALDLEASFLDPDPAAMGSDTPGVVTQPGSVRVFPVPIFLVRTDKGDFLALYARDPYLGCRIAWHRDSGFFEDPCHGSRYTRLGEWITGPSARGMDRFGVRVSPTGMVLADLSAFQYGASHH